MFYNPAFDEANYYQGTTFQVGGLDRGLAQVPSLIGFKRSSTFRSDEKIQEDAWRALIRNFRLDLRNLDINVCNGNLRITGRVASIGEKQEAERTLLSVPGIVEIINELKVNYVES